MVGVASLVPLDDLRPGGLLLLSDVDGLAVEDALQQVAGSLLDPSPALVESLVLLVLDEALSVLEGGARDVDGLAGVGVDEDAGVVEGDGVVDWDDVEELVEDVGVELLVPEDAFQGDGLASLGGSLEPEGVVLVLLHLEQLVATLLTGPEVDLIALLVPNQVGLAVHDFVLVLARSHLLDHPELSDVVGVGGGADDSGLVVALVVGGLDLEGLVLVMADQLVDVSSGEHEGLHRIFRKFINI